MPTLKDIVDRLRLTITGTTSSDIDDKLDTAIKNISTYNSHISQHNQRELLKYYIEKYSGEGVEDISLFSGQTGAITAAALGQGKRLARYRSFRSIVDNISYCWRALKVLVFNIISPDDITKYSVDIDTKKQLSSESGQEAQTAGIKDMVATIGVEDLLPSIIYDTLMLGDCFVEIADSEQAAITSSAILSESKEESNGKELVEMIFEPQEEKDDDIKLVVEIEYPYTEEGNSKDEYSVNDLKLIKHESERVVKLQPENLSICFGFLVFPKLEHLSVPGAINANIVNDICSKILDRIKSHIQKDKKDIDSGGEFRDFISSVVSALQPSEAMKIRYIPPDRMIHWTTDISELFPYGKSIFSTVEYECKLLMSIETAMTIARLSRSTEKRLVGVEIGLPRAAAELTEKLKEGFRKRKVSIDSFGTIDSIPSNISTFEDIYLPMRDGKRFVEIDSFTGGQIDVRSKVDEVKYIRDSIVAGLMVPAPFLNIEENLSNKAALSEEQIVFARSIIGYQKQLRRPLVELVDKIYKLVNPENPSVKEIVDINFPTPYSLEWEREARQLQDMSTVIKQLEELGVPTEYSKRKFLRRIDWDEVEKFKASQKIDELSGDKPKEEQGYGTY